MASAFSTSKVIRKLLSLFFYNNYNIFFPKNQKAGITPASWSYCPTKLDDKGQYEKLLSQFSIQCGKWIRSDIYVEVSQ